MNKLLLIILTLTSSFLSSQNVYIIGKVQKEDCNKIKEIVASIKGSKKISIFYQNTLRLEYKYHDRNNNTLLEGELNELVENAPNVKTPTSSSINLTKKEIVASNGKRTLLTYNKKDNSQSLNNYNNIDELIAHIKNKKGKKYVFLLVFVRDKPSIKIDSLATEQHLKLVNLQCTASSNTLISAIQVRLNKGEWRSFQNVTNCSIQIEIEENKKNLIEVRAIDNMNDTSDILKRDNIIYKKRILRNPAIDYLEPSENIRVVLPCARGGNNHFKFEASFDPYLDLDYIEVFIEDSAGSVIYNAPIKGIMSKGSNNNTFCFFLIYSVIDEEPCYINNIHRYYYYFKNSNNMNEAIMPEKLLIFFENFSKTQKFGNCKCE